MKGQNETDHNTITATIETQCNNQITKRKIMKINNKEGWKNFNNKTENMRNNKQLEMNKSDQYDNMPGRIHSQQQQTKRK